MRSRYDNLHKTRCTKNSKSATNKRCMPACIIKCVGITRQMFVMIVAVSVGTTGPTRAKRSMEGLTKCTQKARQRSHAMCMVLKLSTHTTSVTRTPRIAQTKTTTTNLSRVKNANMRSTTSMTTMVMEVAKVLLKTPHAVLLRVRANSARAP